MDKDTEGLRIDLDEPNVPAVLAGLLDINVKMVYQARQDGKLPSDTKASFRQCVSHYIHYYKKKSSLKLGTVGVEKTIQETRNLRATEELKLLEIKERKQELIEVSVFTETFQPIFDTITDGLIAISRSHPKTDKDIRNLLRTWYSIGQNLESLAVRELETFVQDRLDEDLFIVEDVDDLDENQELENDS
jgi:hypothetical protein